MGKKFASKTPDCRMLERSLYYVILCGERSKVKLLQHEKHHKSNVPCHLHHFFMLVLHQTTIQCGNAKALPMVCEGPSLCHNIGAGSDASSPNPMDHPAHDHSHSSHTVFETSSMTHCIVTVFSSSDPLQTHKICLIVNIILQVLLACLRALQKEPS
jgi:hypothetical protein